MLIDIRYQCRAVRTPQRAGEYAMPNFDPRFKGGIGRRLPSSDHQFTIDVDVGLQHWFAIETNDAVCRSNLSRRSRGSRRACFESPQELSTLLIFLRLLEKIKAASTNPEFSVSGLCADGDTRLRSMSRICTAVGIASLPRVFRTSPSTEVLRRYVP